MSALLAPNRLSLVDADLDSALRAQVVHCRADTGRLVVRALAALGGGRSVGFALRHVVGFWGVFEELEEVGRKGSWTVAVVKW